MRVEGPRSVVGEAAPLVRDVLGAVAHRRPDHPAIESDSQTFSAAFARTLDECAAEGRR